MSRKPFMCGRCHKLFVSDEAARMHARGAHKRGKTVIFEEVGSVNDDDDESFADRAVQATIVRAMGVPGDDDWLLP